MTSSVNDTAMLLAQLRDIHQPTPPGWWPPAIGWWIVAAITIIVITAIVMFRRRRAALLAQHTALAMLARFEREYQRQANAAKFMADVSQLLRQCALTWFPERSPGGLTGDDWLKFLDETGNSTVFMSSAMGVALITAPYGAKHVAEVDAVARATRDWLRVAGEPRRRHAKTPVTAS